MDKLATGHTLEHIYLQENDFMWLLSMQINYHVIYLFSDDFFRKFINLSIDIEQFVNLCVCISVLNKFWAFSFALDFFWLWIPIVNVLCPPMHLGGASFFEVAPFYPGPSTPSCSEPLTEDPKPTPEPQLELPPKQPDQAGNFLQVDS
jgi:hypothetical protein